MLDVTMMTTFCKTARRSGHAASQAGKNKYLHAFPLQLSIWFDVLACVTTANEIVMSVRRHHDDDASPNFSATRPRREASSQEQASADIPASFGQQVLGPHLCLGARGRCGVVGCVALCCVVRCVALRCGVLWSGMLCFVVVCCVVLCCVALCCVVLCCVVLCCVRSFVVCVVALFLRVTSWEVLRRA